MAKVIDVGAVAEEFSGKFRTGAVKQFSAAQDGTRRVLVSYADAGVTVHVVPHGMEHNDLAHVVGHAVEQRLGQYDYECSRLRHVIADLKATKERAERAERKIAKMMTPHNGQGGGDMLLRRQDDGVVWLHGWSDKTKGAAAFGYRFPNSATFWRAHPEYRPIEWGEDETGSWMRLRVIPFGTH